MKKTWRHGKRNLFCMNPRNRRRRGLNIKSIQPLLKKMTMIERKVRKKRGRTVRYKDQVTVQFE